VGSVLMFLFVVAVLGGALNAVAGGGSFLALPALLYAGVAPVAANATTTLAMWPASVASSIAYRRDITWRRRWLVPLGAVSLAGGLLGGRLLMRTSDTSFMRLLPWLMLLATVTFTFGGAVTRRLGHGAADRLGPWALVLQLAIATYGGYFGGGIGIMMLAVMSVAGMTNIHEMNGLKITLAVAINGVALAEFLWHGAVAWTPGLVMAAGGIGGGYAGAAIARRLPARAVHLLVVLLAWCLTAYFFLA
jgi:uncharacterized membrane protein YfcA